MSDDPQSCQRNALDDQRAERVAVNIARIGAQTRRLVALEPGRWQPAADQRDAKGSAEPLLP
jgi:hypothetical protein